MSTLAKAKTTIELNGKLYDARTGKIISDFASLPELISRTIDGNSTAASAPHPKPAEVKATVHVSEPPHQAQSRSKPTAQRTSPAHSARSLEKSKTLMRPAVKKPKAVVAPHITENKDYNFKKLDQERLTRAVSVPKSNHIHKFSTPAPAHTIVKKEAVLHVAVPSSLQAKQITSQVAHLAVSTETQVKQSVDMIEESLRTASAHLEIFEDRIVHASIWEKFGFKNKAANLASLSFAAVLLVGFFSWQNAPNIEMRVAAAQSGVSASMPGYKPAGFSATRDIKSQPGKVSIAFRSNSNDKGFTVTQQSSNWSSEALLSNQVIASKQPYQTYQEEGKTVYIYDNSHATWVNGGIWYSIDGDASLTSDQLLRIANSL